jgi:hypothetical protein
MKKPVKTSPLITTMLIYTYKKEECSNDLDRKPAYI